MSICSTSGKDFEVFAIQVHEVTRRAKRSHIAAAAREVIGTLDLDHLNIIHVCDYAPGFAGEKGFTEVKCEDIFDLIAWSHEKAHAEGWKLVDLWYRTATVGGRSRAYVRVLERFPEWQVCNRESGAYLGTYPGDTDREALDNLARHARILELQELIDDHGPESDEVKDFKKQLPCVTFSGPGARPCSLLARKQFQYL